MSTFPAATAQPTSEMNVTPMIDVLLVVLIIYMLSTMPRHVIPAGLPEPAAAGRTPAPLPQIVLQLEAGGGFTLNSQPVPAAQLRETLQAVYAGREASLLFIRSAPERTYQDVVSAMDVARDAGVQVLALMP